VKNTSKIVLLCCLCLSVFSCVKDRALQVQAADCDLIISYSSQLKPLIQQYCATNLGPGTGCHDAWIFEYENLQAPIESGSFWNVIETRYMPTVPNSFNIEELTPEEIELFRCWIKQGALNN